MRATVLGVLALLVGTAEVGAGKVDHQVRQALNEMIGTTDPQELAEPSQVIVRNFKKAGPRYKEAVLRQLGGQFNARLKRKEDYLVVVATTLAGCGGSGFRTLKLWWNANKSRPSARRAIVKGWGACKNTKAIKYLLDPGLWDKNRFVSEAAVIGMRNYAKAKDGMRKKMIAKLIERYTRVTAGAAGKPEKSKPRKLYDLLRPQFDKSLEAISGGESFDSAKAWAAWFKEASRKPLPKIED